MQQYNKYMGKCGIYKYTNIVNGKVYIGLSTNVDKRENYHYEATYNENDGRYKNHLYSAMRKYGYDKFKFEILEECPKEKLRERERYYINLYQSNDREKGYNLTQGGEHGEHYTRNVYKVDIKTGEIVEKFRSVSEADRSIGGAGNVSSACRYKTRQAKGFLWRYADEYDIEEVKYTIHTRKHRKKEQDEIIKLSKPIGQFSYDGRLIAKYQTRKEASLKTGIPLSSINKCAYGDRKHAGGYIWKDIGKRGEKI